MRLTTNDLRRMDAAACRAVTDKIVDVLGADGSIYRAAYDGSQWVVVTSRGGTTYKIGGYADLAGAFARIKGVADDREAE